MVQAFDCTSNCRSQELDAKFYFLPPIEAFELLPLESVAPPLNLCVLALAAVLLSLSADDDANARLAAVLARSLDRVGMGDHGLLLRHVDGVRMMLWVAERGRRLDCKIVEVNTCTTMYILHYIVLPYDVVIALINTH